MHLLVYTFDIFLVVQKLVSFVSILKHIISLVWEETVNLSHWIVNLSTGHCHLRFQRITWIMPLLRLKASVETLNVHLDAQHLWMRSSSGLHCILRVIFPLF